MKNLIRLFLIIMLGVTCLSSLEPVFADVSQEDPSQSTIIFSGTALFNYYSDTLILLIDKNSDAVASRMDKMPFANIPDTLTEVTNNFSNATKAVSTDVINVESDLQTLRQITAQSRLEEAKQLSEQIGNRIIQARTALIQMERATNASGAEFNIGKAPPDSDIRLAYDRLLGLIKQIGELLDLNQTIFESSRNQIISDSSRELLATEITLKIEPTEVFVGENVKVNGQLTSNGQGLGSREIVILLDSNSSLITNTDYRGYYEATLPIPYQYKSEMQVQALYYPKGADIGTYLASLSPIVKIKVLFYQADIILQLDKKAYPGRALTIQGEISYPNPGIPSIERHLEIYLDNVFMKEIPATNDFSYALPLDPSLGLGDHTVTVSVSADKRYASAFTDATLNVLQAKPIFSGSLPGYIFTPGSFKLNGEFRSEIGLLKEPTINIKFAGNNYRLTGNDQGVIAATNKTKYDFSLIGSQKFEMVVTPIEPWHSTLTITKQILVINTVNCGGFLALMVLSILLLPRRFKIRFSQFTTRKRSEVIRPVLATMPVYSEILGSGQLPEPSTEKAINTIADARERSFSLYRMILKIVQRITNIVLKPQKTLREYAREVEKPLGKTGGYFLDFTRLIEKVIYSPEKVSDADAKESDRIARQIQQEINK